MFQIILILEMLEKLKEVKIRLKYEELFAFMFKINYLKLQNKKKNNGLTRSIDRDKMLVLEQLIIHSFLIQKLEKQY